MSNRQLTIKDQPVTGGKDVTLELIIGLYLLLSLGYGVVNPLFESPDEHHHFFTVLSIKETRQLPTAEADNLARQEAAQPPLYYVLGALLIAPIETADSAQHLWPNPYMQAGNYDSLSNRNAFIHTPTETFPWRGFVLAGHVLRVFSAVLGLITLQCIYASGRLLWPNIPERALLATALVGFLPQFAFIHGSITNDTLITTLCTAGLWQLLRLRLNGMTRPRLLLLGITLGLAILAKPAGLLLFGFVVVAMSVQVGKYASDKSSATDRLPLPIHNSAPFSHLVTLVVFPALFLSGWFLWRNWVLYGDITAANKFVELAGGIRPYSLRQVWGDLDRVWLSLFAAFGWMTVKAPDGVYGVWNGMILVAISGGIGHWVSGMVNGQWSMVNRQWFIKVILQPTFWLLVWATIVFLGWLRFMQQTPADQGRLLFPALMPMALGVAAGLDLLRNLLFTIYDLRLARSVLRFTFHILPILLAFITSAYCLLGVLQPAYELPASFAEIPPEAALLEIDMGRGVQLVAAQMETEKANPGDWVWVTLYWRASQAPAEALVEEVVMNGRSFAFVGGTQTYHGNGLYPTNLWPPGEIITDQVAMQLHREMVVPTQVRVFVKPFTDGDAVEVGRLKVVSQGWAQPETAVLATLNNQVQLAAAELSPQIASPGEMITVTLRWQVITPPGKELTTFVHLGDSTHPPVAQGDGPPLQGDYPAYWWEAGEVFEDSYGLTIPPELENGRYPLRVGLYDSQTGERVPLFVNGERQLNDGYLVGEITVSK